MRTIEAWRQEARRLKREVYALYFAYRDPRTPWYAKLVAVAVVAYAFSPIDLIPDFIPVLGYLDDLVLLPLGILLARRLIPPPILAESRLRADERMGQGKPINCIAGAVIVGVWLVLAGVCVWLLARYWWG
jgi:uncharacterized membrane protein YkvA (DUF1232 family)